MKKLNVAIIGQGRSGRDIHGAYLLTEDGKKLFNVVAVVDYDEDRRKRAAEQFQCDTYEDYRELFNRNDIDFVVASTYSHLRCSVVTDLLNHKMNVIAEKPFSKYSMECEIMIKAAKDNGVMLSVFQQSRFAPYYVRVKEIINSGVLGKIQHISINFSNYARRWDWQCSQRMYGGEVLNTAPHPMDQALDLLNTDDMPNVFSVLKRINNAGDAEDFVKVILTYPDRPLIEIEVNHCDAYSDHIYRVCGDRGSLRCTVSGARWKYFDEKPMPTLELNSLRGPDGIQPAYCSEKLEWHDFEEKFDGDAFNVGTMKYYNNIYNHLVNGEELAIKPEKVLQQIRIMELAHAQNHMDTIY